MRQPTLLLTLLLASFRAIAGTEFSVYGVGQGDGGVVLLDVPADSAAARAGLKKDDLIQGGNASKVSKVKELTASSPINSVRRL